MNHTNSYNAPGISSVNSAFISQPSSAYPIHKVALPSVSSGKSDLSSTIRSSVPVLQASRAIAEFHKCSTALGSGDLLPPFAARNLIPANGATSGDNKGADSKALVVMQANAFGWDDQIKALNIYEESTVALMASSAHNHQEHAFMAHLPADADVSTFLCTQTCIDKVAMYQVHNTNLLLDMSQLEQENLKLRRENKNLTAKVEAQKIDITVLTRDLSNAKCAIKSSKTYLKRLNLKQIDKTNLKNLN
ncbi:hypothetical protein E3N88_38304 [Mikania micrantha]|uniref:Uncharacterized protein n=1 Tax=Mikania micrantha TaxID=192012 RepID=A0A5N6LTP2_9ASTR|nr:hypothetical protein E3N88_38304 [Mikania micrantha]